MFITSQISPQDFSEFIHLISNDKTGSAESYERAKLLRSPKNNSKKSTCASFQERLSP